MKEESKPSINQLKEDLKKELEAWDKKLNDMVSAEIMIMLIKKVDPVLFSEVKDDMLYVFTKLRENIREYDERIKDMIDLVTEEDDGAILDIFMNMVKNKLKEDDDKPGKN